MRLKSEKTLKRLMILVAEDNETDFYFLQCMLRKAPIAALHRVSDGEEAVNYFLGKGRYADRALFPLPDIFLVDLRLPKIPGQKVLEWLGARPAFKDLRKCVLSGSDLESDREEAKHAGADDYFVKPLSLGHIAALFGHHERETAGRVLASFDSRNL